jgi:cytochrome c oxidase subunit 3
MKTPDRRIIPHGRQTMSDAAVTQPVSDPRQQRETSSFGMWVFLATEIMFFGVLFGAYLMLRIGYPEAFAEASRHTRVLLGTPNTGILLTSSLTMALAVDAADTGSRKAVVRYLAITALLGLGFLFVKGYEYSVDFTEHLVPGIDFTFPGPNAHGAELFFYLYFVMTGFHALHLVIGILVVAVIAWLAARGRFDTDSTPIEVTGLYWHLVDIIWIFLYPLLYLVARS